MQITMQGKYQTRGSPCCPSKPVRLLAVHEGDPFAVVGAWKGDDGQEHLTSWTIDGRFGAILMSLPSSQHASLYDLIPVPTKHEGWMFITKDGRPMDTIYRTKEAAKTWAASTWKWCTGFIFLAEVTWED